MTDDEVTNTPPLPVDPDVLAGDWDSSAGARTLRQQARQTLTSQWDVLLVIALGGALGSLGRWGLGEAVPNNSDQFPWATFIENVTGGLALGGLMVFVIDVWSPSRYVRPFVGVGVLGGFTTFSTYLLDTRSLVAADRAPLAAAYLFGTLAVGLAAVWAGIALARPLAETARRRRQP